MNVALCYESVLPARGGCEHYISDLARRLARDGHAVHLYACRWDAAAMPPQTVYHPLPSPGGVRFLRPWRFAKSVEQALAGAKHDVTMGFDKTWGQDVLYPQGGLHAASRDHNLLKHRPGAMRFLARIAKALDPAARSFARLERKQYLESNRPLIVVNSRMVQRHFERYYDVPSSRLRLLSNAIDPERFAADDRPKRRIDERRRWSVGDDEAVGLFVGMNYRLKGLAPLLRALPHVPAGKSHRLVVVGAPKFGRYERLAKRLGVADRVRFLGFRADPRDAYFAADFLVHPTFYDPCSLVALEALACGLPVLTSKHNGAGELLTPGRDGLVIDDPHDAAALGAAFGRLLDRDFRSACAAQARQTARRWTFDDHYAGLLRIFAEAAALRWAA